MSPVVNKDGSVPPSSQYDSWAPAWSRGYRLLAAGASPGSRMLSRPDHSANAFEGFPQSTGVVHHDRERSISVIVRSSGAPAVAASPGDDAVHAAQDPLTHAES